LKRPVLLPALVSLALFGTLVTGCAKKHSTPDVEPTGAACAQPSPTPEPTGSSSADSLYRNTASHSRPLANITPGPETTPNPSVVVINSNPSGLCAQLSTDGGTTYSKIGNTPLKNTPPFNQTPLVYQIIPRNGNGAFSYAMDQTANGNKTLLYNQTADTSGSMSVQNYLSYKKRVIKSKVNRASLGKHRPGTWFGKPAFSTTLVEVRYKAALLQQEGRQALDLERAANGQAGYNIGFLKSGLQTRVVRVANGDSIDGLTSRLKTNKEVYDVHPVGLRYKTSTNPVIPNDTLFDPVDQWDMYHIQMPNAWGYTEGLPNGLSIGIIDTGADDTNPDIAPKLIYGESDINGVQTVGLGTGGSQDEDGHGTNVSGIASADTNNGEGVAGVGFLTPIKIFRIFPYGNNTSANTTDEAQAIYNAVSVQHVNVISLSLGSAENGGWDSVENDAIQYALSNNVTVVAAAGNERTEEVNAGVDFPGAYDGVIAVGATSLNDSADPCNPEDISQCNPNSPTFEYVSSYSNVGPQLSIVAPGGDPSDSNDEDPLHWITGLYTNTPYGQSPGCASGTGPVCLALYAGTSQATPHVSGTVALMLAKNSQLTPAQIKSTLQSTADDISDPNEGYGRLNAYRALAAVVGDNNNIASPTPQNFIVFAYDNGVANGDDNQVTPHIIDITYPNGLQVNQDGTFRIADLQSANNDKYRIAVWADLNGDGKVDVGDYFGYASTTCTTAGPCESAQGIVASPVTSGFVLP